MGSNRLEQARTQMSTDLVVIYLRVLLMVSVGALVAGCGEAYQAKKELTQRGVGYDLSNYQKTIKAGDKEVAALFLQAGMKVDAASEQGDTALMLAVDDGNVEMSSFLLAHGANANAKRNTDGMNPLAIAALHGNTEIV